MGRPVCTSVVVTDFVNIFSWVSSGGVEISGMGGREGEENGERKVGRKRQV